MSLVLQPLTSGGDLVGGTLASDPQQASQIFEFEFRVGILESGGREMRVERCEDFETSRRRRNGERGGRFRSGESSWKVGGVTLEKTEKGVSSAEDQGPRERER